MLLVLSPLLFWPQSRKGQYFGDCLRVLCGRRTWVGYTGCKGVFLPSDIADNVPDDTANRLMLRYMRRYRPATDIAIILHNWNRI